jgi:hypothetical protein
MNGYELSQKYEELAKLAANMPVDELIMFYSNTYDLPMASGRLMELMIDGVRVHVVVSLDDTVWVINRYKPLERPRRVSSLTALLRAF